MIRLLGSLLTGVLLGRIEFMTRLLGGTFTEVLLVNVKPRQTLEERKNYEKHNWVNMAAAHRARAVVSFVLSEVLEVVIKNESEGELYGRHLSCLQGASREQYRLHN